MKKLVYLICLITFITSCKREENKKNVILTNQSYSLILSKKEGLNNEELKAWFTKDILKDTIPGISLDKGFEFLKNKTLKDTIIVAVLDSPIDINHEGLKNHIWINKKEIDDNGVDDDHNGYIDDINGWNFLGQPDGSQTKFVNNDFVRVLRKYGDKFNDKTIKNISTEDSIDYNYYLKAKDRYNKELQFAKKDKDYGLMLDTLLTNSKKTLSKYFPDNNYTVESLDSLKSVYPKDIVLQDDVLRMTNFIKYGITKKYVDNYLLNAEERVNKILNLNYDDRAIIGDNPDDINDNTYGNPSVNLDLDFFNHSTRVSGLINLFKNNTPKDFTSNDQNILIMPVIVSVSGNEHDKDIALGVRYAVDNGAKVINMSFGKEFSMYNQWVNEAYQYASDHNVLIVSSAGNEHKNLNVINDYYPNDNIDNGPEVSNNFILVGASSYNVDKNLIASFSNYGNNDVDIFAPGHNIQTLLPENQYKTDSGTSLAAGIVSGLAALIWSFYPNLTVKELKEILMKTGTSYHIDVEIKQEDGTKKMIPFSELSKSGKIVNAYNALLMAEQVSKSKE